MKNRKKQSAAILGVSLLAAAWLIAGPDLLSKFGASEKVTQLLTLPVAMIAFFWIVSKNRAFVACERRAFKRLIGK